MRRWAAGLLVMALAAACSGPTDVTGSAGTPVTPAQTERPGTAVGAVPDALRDSLPPCPASGGAAAVDGGLPPMPLECLGPGGPVVLPGLAGKPLIINAWASWCQPCRSELPALASFSREAGEDVTVLGLDVLDEPAAAAALWAELDIPFPSVVDPDGATRPGLSWVGLPVTYFIDADGAIVHRHPGAVTDVDQWRSLAAEHLGIP